jgi:hypothetical protein
MDSLISFDVVTGFAGIPIIVALVEMVKRVVPKDTPVGVYPIVSLIFGLALNVGVGAYRHSDMGLAVIGGLIVGLAASGLYSGGRTVTGI